MACKIVIHECHFVNKRISFQTAIENLLDLVTLPELEYLSSSFAPAFPEDTYSSNWWLGDYT